MPQSEQASETKVSKKKSKKAKANKNKNTIVSMREILAKPIDQDNNMGFKIMSKFGFKPGMGLGKEENGIVDPIKINLNSNRRFGIKNEKDQKKIEEAAFELNPVEGAVPDRLKDLVRNLDYLPKQNMKKLIKMFHKCQTACETLDFKYNRKRPEKAFFWRYTTLLELGLDDYYEEYLQYTNANATVNIIELIRELQKYLRDVYFYCVWCIREFKGNI